MTAYIPLMQHGNITKYRPYKPVELPDRQWPNRMHTHAPHWCSVDLRDGNQALAIPMSVEEKLEMFDMLVEVGFKEIEVGFPAAADVEYTFCRRLIDEKRIPEDVTIQILTQAREHLIRRSFEAIQGAPRANVHLYNSTSPLQRKVTFDNASREDIKEIACKGAKLIAELAPEAGPTEIQLQYSPESFSDTELDFALECCTAVMDIWKPTNQRPMILNLPATVEWFTPNIHADQIEWFCRQLGHENRREQAIISLHTHNDRGTGVAATELGLLAGADRVEGTLFGNGERTGNLDMVTVALNLYTNGIDPRLEFSELPRIREIYERCTRMQVHERHPYAGELVFTAFSGSHQDAIKKGMDVRKQLENPEAQPWEVPYLSIDPTDVGRTYEAIIRINSQSGKGGIAYILGQDYGLDLPKSMHAEVGRIVGQLAEKYARELTAEEIHQAFERAFLLPEEPLKLLNYDINSHARDDEFVEMQAEVRYKGETHHIKGRGNGPINAFVYAIDEQGWKDFNLLDYRSHAIGGGSATKSAAYIQIKTQHDYRPFWGCGIHTNIEMAGLKALVVAYNRSRADGST